jgi:hypothetical protein
MRMELVLRLGRLGLLSGVDAVRFRGFVNERLASEVMSDMELRMKVLDNPIML